jgi:hypothetical protein
MIRRFLNRRWTQINADEKGDRSVVILTTAHEDKEGLHPAALFNSERSILNIQKSARSFGPPEALDCCGS